MRFSARPRPPARLRCGCRPRLARGRARRGAPRPRSAAGALDRCGPRPRTGDGVYVTIDKGKTWTAFSTTAPNVIIRDLAVQKRDRDLVIGTYGRGIYIADIAPLKEFKADNLAKDAYLFDVEETVRWNRYLRQGEQYGEFAKVDNPPIGATIYYSLKGEPKSVKLVIKDLEGNVVQELAGNAKKGLQKAAWNLARRPAAGATPPPGGGRGVRANLANWGVRWRSSWCPWRRGRQGRELPAWVTSQSRPWP